MTGVFVRKDLDTDVQREDNVTTGKRDDFGISRPRREASEETNPVLNILPPDL